MCWFNPVSTRIPDAHFLTEARYRGARVVTVAPDLNSSAIHADQWINPLPGSDAALALAAVQVILEEGLHDEAYIRERNLRQQIQQLRIEIDEVKRQQQVSEIIETDFFQDLQDKAKRIRRRSQTDRFKKSD